MESYEAEPKPSIIKPVMIGVVISTALTIIPIVSALNLCCCLWFMAGAVAAVLIYRASSPLGITSGTGAVIGLFTGLISGILVNILNIIITLNQISGDKFEEYKTQLADLFETVFAQIQMDQAVQDEFYQRITDVTRDEILSGAIWFGIIFIILVSAISTIAGLVTAAIAGKRRRYSEEPPPYEP